MCGFRQMCAVACMWFSFAEDFVLNISNRTLITEHRIIILHNDKSLLGVDYDSVQSLVSISDFKCSFVKAVLWTVILRCKELKGNAYLWVMVLMFLNPMRFKDGKIFTKL